MSIEQPQQNNEHKVEMSDVFAFGELLAGARAKLNKSHKTIAKELNLHTTSPDRWENASEFPQESRLTDIAQVYGLDLTRVIEVFKLSKQARKLEKEARKELEFRHSAKKGTEHEFDPFLPERSGRLKRSRTKY